MDRDLLTSFPRILHDRRLADIYNLLDHIQFRKKIELAIVI
jgi:hypothetical protein